jgi:hypothetical protein
VTTKMFRHSGRSPRGERLVVSVSHGHWKTLTFIAALRVSGLTAPYVIDGAMDGATRVKTIEHSRDVLTHDVLNAGAKSNGMYTASDALRRAPLEVCRQRSLAQRVQRSSEADGISCGSTADHPTSYSILAWRRRRMRSRACREA